MQLMPLQDLNVPLFQIKVAGKHPRYFAIVGRGGPLPEQLDNTAVLAVVNGTDLLRDKVGVIFGAHVPIGYLTGAPGAVNERSLHPQFLRTRSR